MRWCNVSTTPNRSKIKGQQVGHSVNSVTMVTTEMDRACLTDQEVRLLLILLRLLVNAQAMPIFTHTWSGFMPRPVHLFKYRKYIKYI